VDEAIDILGLESRELAELAREHLSSGAGVAAQLYASAFRSGVLAPEEFGLSKASAEAWRRHFSLGLLEVRRVARDPEGLDPTEKAVLGLADGLAVEAVRIPMPGGDGGKATICVSSQVGCRMGCAFCETGRAGLVRNLRAAEIVSQVLTARLRLGWGCGNVVFMGMGECLDNLEAVAKALAVLGDQRGLGYAQERLTLCTSGPRGAVEALRDLGLKRLNLSVSLNAASDDKRSALMPVNRSNDLEALAASLGKYPMRRGFALGVNWCLLPGINDTREDARETAAFCSKVGRCVVNLIPYNPGSSPITRAPAEEEIIRFASWLEGEGCFVKRRATKGGGIMAGCGQLGGPAAEPSERAQPSSKS